MAVLYTLMVIAALVPILLSWLLFYLICTMFDVTMFLISIVDNGIVALIKKIRRRDNDN